MTSNYLTMITAIAAFFSAVFAAVQIGISVKNQEIARVEDRKLRTFAAYSELQTNVLDKLVSFTKTEIRELVNVLNECDEYGFQVVDDARIAYDDYRALIAKCEHFAIGVNERIYDIRIVEELGGVHLIGLFNKVKPIIDRTRSRSNVDLPYSNFEKMISTIKKDIG